MLSAGENGKAFSNTISFQVVYTTNKLLSIFKVKKAAPLWWLSNK